MERSNATRKHFIDVLHEAFGVSGGEAWTIKRANCKNNAEEEQDDVVIIANMFDALELNGIDDESSEDGVDEGPQPAAHTQPQRRQPEKGSRKSKKGRRAKKTKTKQNQASATESDLADVPLESYRIIQDEDGIVTDHLVALYALTQEWMNLWDFVQELWHQVAYDELNSAVAGVVSHIAIGMVKRLQTAIFVDFPGHDSYETVFETLTRVDPELAQGVYHLDLCRMPAGASSPELVGSRCVDINDQFLIHTYWSLFDFITDFQVTPAGNPPSVSWPRSETGIPISISEAPAKSSGSNGVVHTRYTGFLILLTFSLYTSFQRNTMRGEKYDLAKIDWSLTGPGVGYRRLFGLNEFAGFVTPLAMQLTGTKI